LTFLPLSPKLVAQGTNFMGLMKNSGNREQEESEEDKSKQLDPSDGREDEDEDEEAQRRVKGKLVDAEERQTGAVEWEVYWQYLLGTGGISFLFFMLAICLALEVTTAAATTF